MIVRKELNFFLCFTRQEFIRQIVKTLQSVMILILSIAGFVFFSIADRTPSDARSVRELRGRHAPFAQKRIHLLADYHSLFLYRCPYLRIHYKP